MCHIGALVSKQRSVPPVHAYCFRIVRNGKRVAQRMASDIGLVGLGVMGSNMALNIGDHGFRVAVFNRSPGRTQAFMQQVEDRHSYQPCCEYATLCAELKSPRVVLSRVTAGPVVDQVIASLLAHLEPGDVLVDGGNAFYRDTARRYAELRACGSRAVNKAAHPMILDAVGASSRRGVRLARRGSIQGCPAGQVSPGKRRSASGRSRKLWRNSRETGK